MLTEYKQTRVSDQQPSQRFRCFICNAHSPLLSLFLEGSTANVDTGVVALRDVSASGA